MNIAYFDPLNRAWNRMTDILFHPFDLAKWLVIGFAAWLAGLADGGGGGGRAFGVDPNDFPSRHNISQGLDEIGNQFLEHALLLPFILTAGLLLLVFILALVWVSSRAKFIFLDNVVQNRAAIVDPWSSYSAQGNSLFLWRLGFGVLVFLTLGVVLLLFIGPAAGFSIGGGFRGLSIAAMALAGVLVLIIGLGASYVSLFLEAFIIPIMYKYRLSTTEAWRYFLPWLKSHSLQFVVYGPFVLLLFMVFAIVFAIACLLTCCVLALPYVGTVLMLPIIMTYRILSLEFLAQFDPGFDLFADVVTDEVVDEIIE